MPLNMQHAMKHIFKLTEVSFIIGTLSLFLTTCSSPSTGNSTFEPSLGDSVVSTMPPYTFNAGDSNGAFLDASDSSLPIEMDSIVFEDKLYMDCESCSHPVAHYSIPKLKTSDSEYAALVERINKEVLKLIDYEEDEEYGRSIWVINTCAGVDFSYEFYSNLLYISLHMVRHCAHGDCDDGFSKLFDLTTGDEIEQKQVLFSDLFSTKGYFDFLNKIGWTDKVKNAYRDGYEQAFKDEPYYLVENSDYIERQALRAQFGIDYEFINDELKISMYGEGTMGHALRCYDPYVDERFKMADLKPYLSEVGEKLFFERDTSKGIIENQLWLNKLYEQIEDYLYLGIFIEGKPYKMALNCQNPDKVWGYLYDEKGNCEEIEGFLSFGIFVLNSERRGEMIVECAQLENYNSPKYYGYTRKYGSQ